MSPGFRLRPSLSGHLLELVGDVAGGGVAGVQTPAFAAYPGKARSIGQGVRAARDYAPSDATAIGAMSVSMARKRARLRFTASMVQWHHALC